MSDPLRVRFVLSSNRYSSVTRLTADTANVLTRLGIEVVVSYPAVDYWDYQRFALRRARGMRKLKQLLRMGSDWLREVPFRKEWCAGRFHSLSPSVRTERYGIFPSAAGWTPDEITVVHPPYLLPHVLQTIPHSGIKVVSALHMNLEKAIQSPCPEAAAWYRHWVARERLVSIPRYTTSEQAREAAERLGIAVRCVIPDGVDLSLFRPSPGANTPLRVTLYCIRHPQKGQASGLEAIRMVRAAAPEVQLCSLGELLPGSEGLFHHRYGYLRGEAYAGALRESGIVVYPSLYDGFPAPPLQAMASGAALVATAVDGVQDYAVDGQNCLLARPGDSSGLAQAVLRLIRDSSVRETVQRNGLETAGRFDVDRTTRRLLEFLREVYGEPPLRQREEEILLQR